MDKKFSISFDFDSTLSPKKIQLLLSVMDRSKIDVFIVTSRNPTDEMNRNVDLMEIAESFNIPAENIYCTSGMPKSRVLENIKADIHFDDMPDEIAMINAECTHTLGVLVTKNIWGDFKYLESTFSEQTGSIQEHLNEFD